VYALVPLEMQEPGVQGGEAVRIRHRGVGFWTSGASTARPLVSVTPLTDGWR
jgi:hypothetical protein